jgi:hypothetical protein
MADKKTNLVSLTPTVKCKGEVSLLLEQEAMTSVYAFEPRH